MRTFFKVPLLIFLLSVTSTAFFTACNKADKSQLQKLDSLDALIGEAKTALKVDTAKIKKRSSDMKSNMSVIQRYYKGGYTEDLARDMDVYRGIQKIYSRFLDAWPVISAEYRELEQQARNLRYSTKKGQFSESEFLENYNREYSDARKNAENIRLYVGPVNDAEEYYKRIQPRVDSMLSISKKEE